MALQKEEVRILVVDDIENMRRLLAGMLLKLGFSSVILAKDGKDAWLKLQEHEIDLLIADWNMPQMSGLDLLKAVRESQQFASLPVLMVTAERIKQNIVLAAQNQVNGYIVKPFSPATLEEKITDILKVS